jgi:hypothetical protein
MRPASGQAADRAPETVTAPVAGAREPTRAALAPGQLIASRYLLLEEVGRGGSGVVYRALDQLAEAEVALKALDARLHRELRLGRSVNHPNVCRIHDVFESEGRWFLTMEYASRGTLRTTLRAGPTPRSASATLADVQAAVAGLTAIHRAGLVHCDLKPENVLRTGDGRLVVSDFGLARTLEQNTVATNLEGTPGYLAPEVLTGARANQASDVWSLGVMIHEMLTGDRPQWVGDGPQPLLRRAGRSDALTSALGRICDACLQMKPTRRPADGSAVQALLEVSLRRSPRKLLMWRLALMAAVAVSVGAGIMTFGRAINPLAGPHPPVEDTGLRAPARLPPAENAFTVAAAGGQNPGAFVGPADSELVNARYKAPPVRGRRAIRPPPPPETRDPGQARVHIERGLVALSAGRASQAENEFTLAVAADGRNAEGFVGLADSQFENARYETALESARRAIKLKYPGIKPYVLAGHAHMKRGEFRQAVKAYRDAARIAPHESSIEEYITRAKARLSNAPEGGGSRHLDSPHR